jgi:two-component system response regulator
LDFLYRRGRFQDAPNLPKYDGRQLLEKVKSDPDLARIPVVVLTCAATNCTPTPTSPSRSSSTSS